MAKNYGNDSETVEDGRERERGEEKSDTEVSLHFFLTCSDGCWKEHVDLTGSIKSAHQGNLLAHLTFKEV